MKKYNELPRSISIVFVILTWTIISGCSNSISDKKDVLLYSRQVDIATNNDSGYSMVVDHLFSIADSVSGDRDPVIGSISSVAFDDTGGIYVGDGLAGRIHYYDSNGNYTMSFGSRGRGPGEIMSIRGIIVQADTVVVWDSASRKFDLFGRDGGYIESRLFSAAIMGAMFMDSRTNNISILFAGDADARNTGYVYHEYRAAMDLEVLSGIASEFIYPDDMEHTILTSMKPGYAVNANQALYYATYPYNGFIYVYRRVGKRMREPTSIIRGGDVKYPPAIIYDELDPRAASASIRGSHMSGRNIAIDVENEVRGMWSMPCGIESCIVVVYAIRGDGGTSFHYDLINATDHNVSTSSFYPERGETVDPRKVVYNYATSRIAVFSSYPAPFIHVSKIELLTE